MPVRTPLIITLGLLTTLAAGMLQAAPQNARQDQPGGGPAHQNAGGNPGQGQAPAPAGNGQRQAGGGQPAPGKQQAQPSRGQPPQDFSSVHQAFHERREQIGRGPALPPDVRIVKGQPLPRGYGKRLDSRALQGLPHYEGYEWRRVGSDIVLVTLTTGIVYTILSGVLN
ncbi:anti-virulence regulator CigR family protein [Phytopseudomonas dryadis]|uniref:Nickel/cobalt transporter regulator n=1 Tax=Phytopseudomonas dryadis TaxID=2487520 RepID=A0ABY1Z6W9_9GAMM|nr:MULTISPECIES: anti-virulence regulator CigR family protein [Pseudomonas]TBV04445.1 hypothetical protein DNK34_14900 [Pseudomonas dryadis]TBV17171.1 hypothetical protein DNK41_13825 [Pseudomonas sp. FRB 230]